jgi:hypothetical protein
VTWDPLLADDWPSQWSPFNVVVRPCADTIHLIVEGHLDAWTVGALLRNLAAVYEPCFADVHLDLRHVTHWEHAAEGGIARCRDFASSRGAAFRITPPLASASPAPAALRRTAG